MGRSEFQLIPPAPAPPRSGPAGTVALAVLLFATGLFATLRGADSARQPSAPREQAGRLVQEVLKRGTNDSTLLAGLTTLRHRVARLPLDATARSAYATALTVFAGNHEELDAAAYHARTAARCAPVTVPVVRRAAIVLAQAGHLPEATDLTREMFTYDPPAAARLLATLEPFLSIRATRDTIADDPRAWLARISQLRIDRRYADANELLDEAANRWPDELPIRGLAAERAMAAKDWGRMALLLPPEEVFPDRSESAILYVYRSRMRSATQDLAGARQDVDMAISLAGHAPWLLILAGDAWLDMNRPDRAREMWSRALNIAPIDSTSVRSDSLRRLARMAERQGQGGTALRMWRDLLELNPDDDEARDRLRELGGTR